MPQSHHRAPEGDQVGSHDDLDVFGHAGWLAGGPRMRHSIFYQLIQKVWRMYIHDMPRWEGVKGAELEGGWKGRPQMPLTTAVCHLAASWEGSAVFRVVGPRRCLKSRCPFPTEPLPPSYM